MSEARDPSGHGGRNDPEFRIGRGNPARRRILALALAVVLVIFAVLLTIWLLGRSADEAQGAAETAGSCCYPSSSWPRR